MGLYCVTELVIVEYQLKTVKLFLELLPIFFINIDAKSMMRTIKDLSKITEDFDVITEEFNIFALMLDKGYFK